MTEKQRYTIADCPRCGKHDLVETDNNKWICLNCDFSKNLSANYMVAECPACHKQDFVEKKPGQWKCLSCNHIKEIDSAQGSSIVSLIVSAFVTLLLLSVLL